MRLSQEMHDICAYICIERFRKIRKRETMKIRRKGRGRLKVLEFVSLINVYRVGE
jgi:hypothetical protein